MVKDDKKEELLLSIKDEYPQKIAIELLNEISKSCLNMTSKAAKFDNPDVILHVGDNRLFRKAGDSTHSVFSKSIVSYILNLSYCIKDDMHNRTDKIETLYDIIFNSPISSRLPEKNDLDFNIYKTCKYMPNRKNGKYECDSSVCTSTLASENIKSEHCNSCPIYAIYNALLDVDKPKIFYAFSNMYPKYTYPSYAETHIENYKELEKKVNTVYDEIISFERNFHNRELIIDNAWRLLFSCSDIIEQTSGEFIDNEKLAYIFFYYYQLMNWPPLKVNKFGSNNPSDFSLFQNILHPASLIIRSCYDINPSNDNLSLFIKIEQARIVSFMNKIKYTPFNNEYNIFFFNDIVKTDFALIDNNIQEKNQIKEWLPLYIELINLLRYSVFISYDGFEKEQIKIETLLDNNNDDELYIRYYLYKFMYGYKDIKQCLSDKFHSTSKKMTNNDNYTDTFLAMLYMYNILGGFIDDMTTNSDNVYTEIEDIIKGRKVSYCMPMSYPRIYGDEILNVFYYKFYHT